MLREFREGRERVSRCTAGKGRSLGVVGAFGRLGLCLAMFVAVTGGCEGLTGSAVGLGTHAWSAVRVPRVRGRRARSLGGTAGWGESARGEERMTLLPSDYRVRTGRDVVVGGRGRCPEEACVTPGMGSEGVLAHGGARTRRSDACSYFCINCCHPRAVLLGSIWLGSWRLRSTTAIMLGDAGVPAPQHSGSQASSAQSASTVEGAPPTSQSGGRSVAADMDLVDPQDGSQQAASRRPMAINQSGGDRQPQVHGAARQHLGPEEG